jgi:hypothetical protein
LSDPVDRPKTHAAVIEIRTSENWELIPASPQIFSDGLTYPDYSSAAVR